MSSDSLAASGLRAASAIPGRIRLRAIDASRAGSLASVADVLRGCPDVTSVQLRARSASLVVRFEPERATAVAERLLSLGVDLRVGVARPLRRSPAAVVAAAAASADREVAGRLNGTDLRILVPLGLGLLAARRALRGDQRLADAPWYVLAWYASETFSKFHGGAAALAHVDSEGE